MGSDRRRVKSAWQLFAAFGSVHDAETAARQLARRGLPAHSVILAAVPPTSRRGGGPAFRRVLTYAAFGAAAVGLVGRLLWPVFFPDVLDTAWRTVVAALVGASAGAGIGLLVDSGLEPPVGRRAARTAPGSEAAGGVRAVVTVSGLHHPQLDAAAAMLRDLGARRVTTSLDC